MAASKTHAQRPWGSNSAYIYSDREGFKCPRVDLASLREGSQLCVLLQELLAALFKATVEKTKVNPKA